MSSEFGKFFSSTRSRLVLRAIQHPMHYGRLHSRR